MSLATSQASARDSSTIELLEDAVLAGASLLGDFDVSEPVEDPEYQEELTRQFWETVNQIRSTRG